MDLNFEFFSIFDHAEDVVLAGFFLKRKTQILSCSVFVYAVDELPKLKKQCKITKVTFAHFKVCQNNKNENCLSKTVFSIKVDAIFRKIEISKKSYDVHFIFYIFIYIFYIYFQNLFSFFFVLGAKLRPVVVRPRRLSKKNLFTRDSAPPFCFQRIY